MSFDNLVDDEWLQYVMITNWMCWLQGGDVVKTDKSGNSVSNGDGSNNVKEEGDDQDKSVNGNGSSQSTNSSLNWLADVALSKEKRSGPNCTKSKNGTGSTGTGAGTKAAETVADGGGGGPTVNGSDGESEMASDDEGGEHFSTLRELLIRPAPKSNSKNADQSSPIAKRQKLETLEDVISCVIERGVDRESSPENSTSAPVAKDASGGAAAAGGVGGGGEEAVAGADGAGADAGGASGSDGESSQVESLNVELNHFKRRKDVYKTIRTHEPLSVRIMLQSESSNIYPDIPHSWVCKGRMLRLHDPSNPSNYKIFQVCHHLFHFYHFNL